MSKTRSLFAGSAVDLARPYQAEAIEANLGALDGGQDPMTVMATGLGKTICLATIGREWAERTETKTLFLVHRSELADQLEGWLARIDPEHPAAREQGDSEVVPGLWDNRYTVAMVQSISQDKRLKRYDPKRYGLIVTDEGHHGHATTYEKVREHFKNGNERVRLAGFSACWTAANGTALGRKCGYNTVAYQYRVRRAIREGWLVPVRTLGVTVDGLTWGDSPSLEDIDAVLEQEEPLHKLVKTTLELAGDRQVLAFCGRKTQVRALAAVFNRPEYRPGSTRFITDEQGSDPLVRRALADDFRAGLFQTMVNAGVYTEGTDFPGVSCVVIARPCKSEPLAAQIVGRGMRPEDKLLDDRRLWASAELRLAAIAGSKKRDCLLLDFNLNVAGRKLLTVDDVLGEEYTPQVRDYAKTLPAPREGEPEDVLDRLDRAAAEWALIQEEITRRAGVAARAVTYRTDEVDIFDPRSQAAAPTPKPQEYREPASDQQVWRLVNHQGWKEASARALSKKQASAIISKFVKKESAKGFAGLNDPIAVPMGDDSE